MFSVFQKWAILRVSIPQKLQVFYLACSPLPIFFQMFHGPKAISTWILRQSKPSKRGKILAGNYWPWSPNTWNSLICWKVTVDKIIFFNGFFHYLALFSICFWARKASFWHGDPHLSPVLAICVWPCQNQAFLGKIDVADYSKSVIHKSSAF